MKKLYLSAAVIAALLFSGAVLTSCDDDDDKMPDNNPITITFENVTAVKNYVQSGTFDAAQPGGTTTIVFNAGKGQTLMFATMYGYSNDLFFAPENPGLKLYTDDGTPRTGDVSAAVQLWDNGTRVNQKPGPDVTHPGTAEVGNVTQITDGRDVAGNTYLPASSLMKLTLAYDAVKSEFTLTIANISSGTANETPFSAGVWVVSNVLDGDLIVEKPFFEKDQKSSTQLTALAENGNTKPYTDLITPQTGIITTLSPAIVVIYTGDTNPIYTLGQKDAQIGLAALAQRGDPSQLVTSLGKLPQVKHIYTTGDDMADPGQKMYTQYEAAEGDKLAYALMFGYSNDWFYANESAVNPLSRGDISNNVVLLDDGTAVSQYPGAGNAQLIFGGTLMPEEQPITKVGDTYPVPSPKNVIKVTIN